MKKLLPITLLFLAAIAKGQTIPEPTAPVPANDINQELDSRYGFLGNKFDTPFTSFKGLIFVEDSRGYKIYKKSTDIQDFGKAKITSVRYSFYKGLLAAVHVKGPNNLENEEAWRELLKAAYGPAQDSVVTQEMEDLEAHNYGGNYLWHGNKAYINLSLHLGDPISVYVGSQIAARRKDADAAAALKRAAQKL